MPAYIKHVPARDKDINLVSAAKIQTEIYIFPSSDFRFHFRIIASLQRHISRIGMCAVNFERHPILVVTDQIHVVICNREPAIKINAHFAHEAASPVNA
ncbi:hypothetical protein D1872_283830 [compost metagenome]